MDEEMKGKDFKAVEINLKEMNELFGDGCKFYVHRAGVVCPDDGHRKCDKCGWNPSVEKKRKEKLHARREKFVYRSQF